MKAINLVINGIKVTAETEMTILQAAKGIGIDIPTLCYHEKLAPYGACRLCTVEIIRGKHSRLVASCVYPVEDGLIVETESERVVKIRKLLLELLWARVPGIQALRNYELRNYGLKYGITEAQAKRFETEPTFCILCGLCVRYCAEVKKKHAIGFIGRGTQKEVVLFPAIARKECPGCQECYPLCPTGILPSYFTLIMPH